MCPLSLSQPVQNTFLIAHVPLHASMDDHTILPQESKTDVVSTSIGKDSVLLIFDYLTVREKCVASRTCLKYNSFTEKSLIQAAKKQFKKIGLFEGINGQNLIQELPKIRSLRAKLGPLGRGNCFDNNLHPEITPTLTDLRRVRTGALLLIHNLNIENSIPDQPALMAFVNTHDIGCEIPEAASLYSSLYENKCVILTPNTFASFSERREREDMLSFRLEAKFLPLHVDYFRRLISGMPCGHMYDGIEGVRTIEKRRRFLCCFKRKVSMVVSVVALEKPIKIKKTKTE